MKIYISADIEGVNGITAWEETSLGKDGYAYFQRQMTEEVRRAAIGARRAGADLVFVKDAHDEGRNIIPSELPEYTVLHRGWEGSPEMMMEGLSPDFDAVLFIGYHSGMLSSGNPLAHTLDPNIQRITLNGEKATEFLINALYASSLNVPVAFLSGDEKLTQKAKRLIPGIETVATVSGAHGATVSRHPSLTNQEMEEAVYKALKKDFRKNIIPLPERYVLEVEYRTHKEAYSASFFPKAELVRENVVRFESENFYDVLVFFKFAL